MSRHFGAVHAIDALGEVGERRAGDACAGRQCAHHRCWVEEAHVTELTGILRPDAVHDQLAGWPEAMRISARHEPTRASRTASAPARTPVSAGSPPATSHSARHGCPRRPDDRASVAVRGELGLQVPLESGAVCRDEIDGPRRLGGAERVVAWRRRFNSGDCPEAGVL